jgi:hypothetical protein
MLHIKYDIQSKELNSLLNIKVKNNKFLFFAALSKLSSIYNLSTQGHELAKVELYKIISELEKILKSYSKEIQKYKQTLQKYDIQLKPIRSIDVNVGGYVALKLFEALKNIDVIHKRNHCAFIKTGRNPKDNIIHEYSRKLKALLSQINQINVQSLIQTIDDKAV